MEQTRNQKKRKPIGPNIPPALMHYPAFAADSQMYTDLLEMERKLDWSLSRKRTEVQDVLARGPMTSRTLRIFISHTVSGQSWQSTANDSGTVDFETGQGIPAWALKIEGRLLELPSQRARDKVPQRKFSTFIKKIVIELERDPSLYPDGNIVEWNRPMQQTPLDGFSIRRTGDSPTSARIVIYLEQNPEIFTLSEELANVLCMKEGSRVEVIQALWNYIKIKGLQDKMERRLVKMDDTLQPLFGREPIPINRLPELINSFLGHPKPIVVHYTIDPRNPPPERACAWDVEVKMEDVVGRAKMGTLLTTSKASVEQLNALDEEIHRHALSIQNSSIKLEFLTKFANDPAEFIQTWLASQSRDLETILSDGGRVRTEDLKRSDFFRLPWVEEAIAVQQGYRATMLSGR